MSNVVGDPKAPEKAPVKTVYNRSRARRYYILKDGRKLMPGTSAEVDLAEFKQLCNYKDIVDSDKIVPGAAEAALALRQSNAKLQAQIDDMSKDPVIAERLAELAKAVKGDDTPAKTKGKK